MAVGTVQSAAAVEIRARLVSPVIASDVSVRHAVAVMTGRGPVSVTAVQVVTGVAHQATRFQLPMGSCPMNPVRWGFAPGGIKVTLHALGAGIVAAGTV